MMENDSIETEEDNKFKLEDSQDTYYEEVESHSKMVGWAMKLPFVKSEKQANYVLIAVAIIFFIYTIVTLLGIKTPVRNAHLVDIKDIPDDVKRQMPPEVFERLNNLQKK